MPDTLQNLEASSRRIEAEISKLESAFALHDQKETLTWERYTALQESMVDTLNNISASNIRQVVILEGMAKKNGKGDFLSFNLDPKMLLKIVGLLLAGGVSVEGMRKLLGL